MVSIGISTVDELLKLGGKIADIVTILLTRKASKEEQKQVQLAVEEFNRLKQIHLQIRTLLEEYNKGLGRATLNGGVQALFPLCTHHGFKRTERIYAANTKGQVSYEELTEFELLSVKLVSETRHETSLMSTKAADLQWAEACTSEKWIVAYQTGAKCAVEAINRYQLVWQEEGWKVNSSEVFSKDASTNR